MCAVPVQMCITNHCPVRAFVTRTNPNVYFKSSVYTYLRQGPEGVRGDPLDVVIGDGELIESGERSERLGRDDGDLVVSQRQFRQL